MVRTYGTVLLHGGTFTLLRRERSVHQRSFFAKWNVYILLTITVLFSGKINKTMNLALLCEDIWTIFFCFVCRLLEMYPIVTSHWSKQ